MSKAPYTWSRCTSEEFEALARQPLTAVHAYRRDHWRQWERRVGWSQGMTNPPPSLLWELADGRLVVFCASTVLCDTCGETGDDYWLGAPAAP